MIGIRRLTPTLRKRLKSPLGLLIRGSFDETMRELEKLVERERPSKVISVGDVTSDNMIKHNILPKVLVVDNRVMRKTIKPILADIDRTLHVKNPPGTLTDEAWLVMQEAMEGSKRTRVLVDGEEDLITLVAVLCAPEDAIVVYGQPHEGIVAIKVTDQMKEVVRGIVEAMETPNKLHHARI